MAFTGATAGYQAAAQANDTAISYAMEPTYGVPATGNYQQTRFTGENFKPTDTTQRPDEINANIEASQAVLTQTSVAGTLSGALSYGTYDDMLAAVLGADWANNAVQNSSAVKTWTISEKINGAWLVRPGSFCTRAQLTFAQGSFASIALDFSCKQQTQVTADPATSYSAAPTGRVFDTVDNFVGMTIDGVAPDGCVRQVQITLDRDGSASDYGMGHADACGIRPGQILASGSLQIFFKTWDLYQRWSNGGQGPIAITVKDADGNSYVLTFLNATLRNPVINAGSKNSSIVATFDIEGNPQAGGGTFSIVRNPKATSLKVNQNDVTVGGAVVTP
ncbi:phage tail tube protein [Gluconobacter kondonii]|uniref:phage tail tube protein n=1 Tax=Gluconobacter kondonii TaxID=941463 RepID=UPI0020137FA7|nr:phage tail tube protein [Gluconobacter kondonii]